MNPLNAPVPGGITLPNLPSFSELSKGVGVGQEANYTNIMKTISAAGNQPTISSSVLPQITALLSPGGQKTSPYAQAIGAQTQANVAGAQSSAMARGLTGSDIEAGNMRAAESAGQTSLAQMYGQTADQLSAMIMQAATGDINNNRELLMTLAQAMGQELTSQRDMEMFKKSLQESMAEAGKSRLAGQQGAIVGGLFSMASSGAAAGAKASDISVKKNVKAIGKQGPLTVYEFDYRQDLGIDLPAERQVGFMAQEVETIFPEAVSVGSHGFKMVDYGYLGRVI